MRHLDLSFLPKCRNIIQIRTPIHMLPSWNSNIHVNLKEVGGQSPGPVSWPALARVVDVHHYCYQWRLWRVGVSAFFL